MKLTISGKQLTVRASLRALTEKKMTRFDRFFDDEAETIVLFSCRHDLQYVEITIYYKGTIFRSEEGADTFQTALDGAIEALEPEIRKNKGTQTRVTVPIIGSPVKVCGLGIDLH